MIFLSQFYGMIDLNNSKIYNPVVFWVNALLGTISLIMLLANVKDKTGILSFYGKNSLIMMATTSVFPVVYMSQKLAGVMQTTSFVVIGIIGCLIEAIIIHVINSSFGTMVKFPIWVNEIQMKSEKQISRSEIIDFLKGFAMICVILCHAIQRAGYREVYIDLWKSIYAWHMPIFFFISGYCVSHNKDIKRFFSEKMARLIWPWFIWRFLEYVFRNFEFSGFVGFDSGMPWDFKEFLLFYIKSPFRPMWFLIDLFIFSFILFAVHKLQKNKMLNSLLNIMVVILVVLFRDWLSVNGGANAYLAYDLQFFIYYVLGIECKKYKEWFITNKALCVEVVVFGAITIICNNVLQYAGYWFEIVRALCCFAGLALLGKVIIKKLHIVSIPIQWIGKYSLEFYTAQFICLNMGFGLGLERVISNFILCIGFIIVLILITNRYKGGRMILWGDVSVAKND